MTFELDSSEQQHVERVLKQLRAALDASFEQLDRDILSVTLGGGALTDPVVLRAMAAPDGAVDEAVLDFARACAHLTAPERAAIESRALEILADAHRRTAERMEHLVNAGFEPGTSA